LTATPQISFFHAFLTFLADLLATVFEKHMGKSEHEYANFSCFSRFYNILENQLKIWKNNTDLLLSYY